MRPMAAVIALMIVVAAGGCQATSGGGSDPGRWTTFGESPMGPGDAVTIDSLAGGEQNIVVHGTSADVCTNRGCWMVVKDDAGRELFVRTKGHSYFVPRNSTGRGVVVRGSTQKQVLSVDELRHYAEDAHKSAAEIAAITQPETRIMFFADSVMIAGKGLDEPVQQ